ncbi:MAG: hypothetical protein ACREH5_01265 [Candidatus Omnitrophota bacterium]
MNFKKFSIVTTTIRVPFFLKDFLRDISREKNIEAEFVVIADTATPRGAKTFARSLSGEKVRVDYWDVERQKKWLRRFPALGRLLPYCSIQRRNLGYLIAYLGGADVIVSVDDDNFLTQRGYLSSHGLVGETARIGCVGSRDGWFNICSLLETRPPRRFYHRGYPISKRWRSAEITRSERKGRVVVNAGLWLGDPDVDTFTRLEEPFQVKGFRSGRPYVGLAKGTFSPFNSQNTAYARELLPFLYLVVADNGLKGFKSDFVNFRYDDIWMSYFAKLAIDRMGGLVTFGQPLVLQKRNPHDLLADMDRELIPMFLTETLVELLAGIRLGAGNYLDLYAELIEGLRAGIARNGKLNARERRFFRQMTDGMGIWHRVCAAVMKGE